MIEGDRYDVVVVQTGGPEITPPPTLARDLAHLTGATTPDIELALDHGEFIAYRGLVEGAVEEVANKLQHVGASIEIRPSADPLEMPALEHATPNGDMERLVPALPEPPIVGYSGKAPIAPPPAFGGQPAASPVLASPAPLLDPSRPQGRLNEGSVERPFKSFDPERSERINALTADGAATPALEDARTNSYEPVPLTTSGALGSNTTETGILDMVDQLEAASAKGVAVVTLDGLDSDSVPDELAGEAAKPSTQAAFDLETRPLDSEGPPLEAKLLLDIPEQPASPSDVQPAASASTVAQAHASLPSASVADPNGPPSTLAPVEFSRGLFFRDSSSNYLAGIAAAVFVCLVVAFAVTRSSKKSDILALEHEIAESLRKPLKVESGDVRAPSAVQADLDATYGSAQSRFLLIMFAGVPLGFALGRIRA